MAQKSKKLSYNVKKQNLNNETSTFETYNKKAGELAQSTIYKLDAASKGGRYDCLLVSLKLVIRPVFSTII